MKIRFARIDAKESPVVDVDSVKLPTGRWAGVISGVKNRPVLCLAEREYLTEIRKLQDSIQAKYGDQLVADDEDYAGWSDERQIHAEEQAKLAFPGDFNGLYYT